MIVPVQRQCPHCGGSFERTFFGINLLTTRYERCPLCKKWSRHSRFGGDIDGPPILVEASDSEEESEEDRLRRRIEESRYEGP
jgi:hypothetical protein